MSKAERMWMAAAAIRKDGPGWADSYDVTAEDANRIDEAFSAYESRREELAVRLYEVELAPAEDEYLDWDKPLSEQSEKVRVALGVKLRDIAAEEKLFADAKEMGVSPSSMPGYITALKRERQRNGLTDEEFREKAAAQMAKKRKVVEEFQGLE